MSSRGGGRGRGRNNSRGGRGGRNDYHQGGGGRGGRNQQGQGPRAANKLCRDWTMSGNCPRGDTCSFAHFVRCHKIFPASGPMPNNNNNRNNNNRYNNNYNNNQNNLAPVKAVAVWDCGPQGIKLFSGGDDGLWRLWNSGNGFIKEAEQNMNGPVGCLKVVSNHLFCGFAGASKGAPNAAAGQVHAWNLANPAQPPMEMHMSEPWLMYAHNLAVSVLEVAEGGNPPRVLTGGKDGSIRAWSLQNNKFVLEKSLPGHAGAVTGLCLIPGGNLLWSSSKDGTLRIWDLSQPELSACKHSIAGEAAQGGPTNPQQGATGTGHSKDVTALIPFTMDAGVFLLSGSLDGNIKVWEAATGNCMVTESHGEGIVSMAIATTQANKQVLLVGLESGNIAVRNIIPSNGVQAFSLLFTLESHFTAGHRGEVHAIASGPSSTFYSCGKDGNVMVWQLTGDLKL